MQQFNVKSLTSLVFCYFESMPCKYAFIKCILLVVIVDYPKRELDQCCRDGILVCNLKIPLNPYNCLNQSMAKFERQYSYLTICGMFHCFSHFYKSQYL